MALNILIIGAGVCGPALAVLLQKANPKHTITVIERFASLRMGGQQIDLKDQGIPILRKMGLLERMKAMCVAESGMELVDKNGKRLMEFGVDSADSAERGGKSFGLTNEYEFMRGDMVQLFHDASIEERTKVEKNGKQEGGLTYAFGKTVTAIEQADKTASVTFSDGQRKQYDLIVAADGQGSRTRRLAFGEEASTASFRSLGIHAAYYNIPRLEREDSLARIYFAPKNRMVMTRTGDRPVTQVYFFMMKEKERAEKMKKTYKEPVQNQKEEWTSIYKDAGWECQRLLKGLEDADDFYACEIGQVKLPELYEGRIVMLGDAGYCPSPFTGMGTTLSLIGAYVLAGELARNGSDVEAALTAYTETMKQPIEECQQLAPGTTGGFYATSERGISILNTVLWTISSLRIDSLLRWIFGKLPAGKKNWPVPEYPELHLDASS